MRRRSDPLRHCVADERRDRRRNTPRIVRPNGREYRGGILNHDERDVSRIATSTPFTVQATSSNAAENRAGSREEDQPEHGYGNRARLGEVPREIGGRYVERERNGKTAVGLLYAVKAGVGIGSTLALGLTMLSSSAPLFERIASSITGHKIRIAILNRIGQGIADATALKVAIAIGEKVIAVAAERAGAMVVGRVLLFMASWEIQVAAIAIRVVI